MAFRTHSDSLQGEKVIVAACFKESDEEDEAVETRSQELLVEDIFKKNQCSVNQSSKHDYYQACMTAQTTCWF